MERVLYNIVYVAICLFGTYLSYRFVKLLLVKKRVSPIKIKGICFAQFVLTTFGKIFGNNIGIDVLFELIGLFLLVCIFEGTVKKKIIVIGTTFVSFFLINHIIDMSVNYFLDGMLNDEYQTLFVRLASRLICVIMIMLASNMKSLKNNEMIPLVYWVCIFAFPLSSIFFSFYLIAVYETPSILITICIIIFIMENFLVFYMYDTLVANAKQKEETRKLEEKNKSYLQQYEQMQLSVKATRGVRHDMKNHLTALKYMLEKERYVDALAYVSDLSETWIEKNQTLDCGNVVIDGILNFKMQEAQAQKITVLTDICIPKDLKLVPIDTTIILGNLLDNAICAASKLKEENRKIEIGMRYRQGALYIKVKNPYIGLLSKLGSQLITTKKDRMNHGIGLGNVEETVKKYNGDLHISAEDGFFLASVMLECEVLD